MAAHGIEDRHEWGYLHFVVAEGKREACSAKKLVYTPGLLCCVVGTTTWHCTSVDTSHCL